MIDDFYRVYGYEGEVYKAIEETEKRFKDQINNGGKKPDASGNTEISARDISSLL